MSSEQGSQTRFYDLPPHMVAEFARTAADYRSRGLILSKASAIALRAPDPALEEEARTAARIVRGLRGTAEERARCESEMVKRYSRGLGYLLARWLGDGDRACEALQETFCRAFKKLQEKELEKPERLAGYLRGIAGNVAKEEGRPRKQEPVGSDIEAIAEISYDGCRQFRHVASEETQSAVRKILQSMSSKDYRELLVRFYVDDQGRQEICRELRLTSRQFSQRLFRAKEQFRESLKESAEVADFMSSGGD
jgi:RNA polymerase sigma-70 factor (ECF subfamily)